MMRFTCYIPVLKMAMPKGAGLALLGMAIITMGWGK
jgi:hypothetical protein